MTVSHGLRVAIAIGCVSPFACGCDVGRPEPTSVARGSPPAPSIGYRVVDVVNGGTLSGSVTWVGPRPEVVTVPVMHHADACGNHRSVPVLEVGARGGVANTVLWLDGITEGRALETGPFELAFRGCVLTPRVVAMPVAGALSLVDDEDVLHNVHGRWSGGGIWIDFGLPTRGARVAASADRTGLATLVDDAGHPWIGGFVHVFDHPYYRVTTDDGRFSIRGVPPGQYMVRVWHEGVRMVRRGSDSERPRFSAPLVFARSVALMSGTDTVVDFQLGLAAVDAAGD